MMGSSRSSRVRGTWSFGSTVSSPRSGCSPRSTSRQVAPVRRSCSCRARSWRSCGACAGCCTRSNRQPPSSCSPTRSGRRSPTSSSCGRSRRLRPRKLGCGARRSTRVGEPNDEGRHPSRLRGRDRALFVRQHVHDPKHAFGAARGDLLELPPFLYGQAEARGHGGPRRAVPASLRKATGRPGRRRQGARGRPRGGGQGARARGGPSRGRRGAARRGGAGRGARRGRTGRGRAGLAFASRMADEATRPNHFYGGQAVVEGVMMRGRDVWAVAVRRPAGDLHIESHDIDSVAKRHRILTKPFVRGVIALGQALAIGFRALSVSARESVPEDERLSSGKMGLSMAIAAVIFLGLFIVLPAVAFRWVGESMDSSILVNALEGVFRVALFLGYLLLIGRTKDIRRVFEYHGAEHKTIAAFEHDEPLVPERVDAYPTLHVRCGTNFLLLVMVITIFVFALFGNPGVWWRIGSRIIAIPIIAGIAFELLRLGARFPRSRVSHALMVPGLWLQKITTKPPNREQIEVAIASFNEVLRRESEQPAEA